MSQLSYTETHEWVRIEGTFLTLGITQHAQSQLGDIVFVELPTTKKIVNAGSSIAVVESVKAAADVYTPFTGEITEINSTLFTEPGVLNRDPYGEGWLVKMQVKESEITQTSLLTEKEYENLIQHEA